MVQFDRTAELTLTGSIKDALSEVDTVIRNMKNQLDLHDAEDDVRNKALYVLRTMAKNIQMANGIKKIHRLTEAAHEAFDLWLDVFTSINMSPGAG